MQKRAVRTRQAVLEAAADEFAERGYEGASLQQVAWRAATSIGSLTFHFGTKVALAQEVCAAGRARFARCLEDLSATADPLRELRTLVGCLARLAHEDPFVRAARRLENQHLKGVLPLAEAWLPVFRGLLDRAYATHRLRPGVSPQDALALLAHLTEGAMAAPDTTHDAVRNSAWDSVSDSDSVWDVVLHGLAVDRTGRAGRAGSMRCGAEPV